MKKLLYIGNKLSIHGNTATSIETLGPFLETEGFKIFYASSKKNKFFRMLEMTFMTFKYAKKVDYVLIDTYSTTNFWYAFIISQICRILKVKYIAKLHGGELPNRIKKTKYFSDLLFNNAYKNVAPSNYLFEAFTKYNYPNLIYIPNTIELQLYPCSPKVYDIPRLLWVRSFSKIYNPLMAIKVLIQLKKDYPNAILCMVGPKKDETYDQTMAFCKEHDIEVNFTGKLSKEEWIELSKQYNIFINTTHFDNTPVSLIEAMALGIPIVSTNVGGIPFLVQHQHNALLVDDNDIVDMAFQINRLLLDAKLAHTLVQNAKETVKDFDWEIVKHQWIDLLK
jgi:glycosyltransferase involved in cell wall biosynthesis